MCSFMCSILWRSMSLSSSTRLFLIAASKAYCSEKKGVECGRVPSDGRVQGKASPGGGRGTISWFHLAATGVGLTVIYGAYLYIKDKKDQELAKEKKNEIGMIGSSFELMDYTGKIRTSEDFKGK
jgi:hypothetical protein